MAKKKATPETHPIQKTVAAKPARKTPSATQKRKSATPLTQAPKIETKLVLLPVDPYLIHAFWEIAPSDVDKTKQALNKEQDDVSVFLRFYDHTGLTPEKEELHYAFDVRIDLDAKNWYINLQSAGRSYFAELGLKTNDSRFISITRSNNVDMPSDQPAPKSEKYHLPIGGIQTTASKQASLHSDYLKRATSKDAEPVADDSKTINRPIDLTEMNEKEFNHGISSNAPTE